MLLKRWQDIPDKIQNDQVIKYYDYLYKKRYSLLFKRVFDFILAIALLMILAPVIFLMCVFIKISTRGPAFYRQVRVTQYGKEFKIIKLCTMKRDAHKGTQVTTRNDDRVTGVGRFLRKYRLDEIPQLINIIKGDMSFVGTRPEVPQFVGKYTAEMMATLLLPAGVTSEASILYKDEEMLLADALDAEETYINEVLPCKMKYNLKRIEQYSFIGDIKTMFRTIAAVLDKGEMAYNCKNTETERTTMLQG